MTNGIYLECPEGKFLVSDEDEATDLVGLCGENETSRLLLYHSNLHPDFFDLKTGLAGAITQKFSNYFIRTAIVLEPGKEYSTRFMEWAGECNRGRMIHFAPHREDALRWFEEK